MPPKRDSAQRGTKRALTPDAGSTTVEGDYFSDSGSESIHGQNTWWLIVHKYLKAASMMTAAELTARASKAKCKARGSIAPNRQVQDDEELAKTWMMRYSEDNLRKVNFAIFELVFMMLGMPILVAWPGIRYVQFPLALPPRLWSQPF
jgi:hypothetical protein